MEKTRPTLLQQYHDSTSKLLTGLTLDKTPSLWRDNVLDQSMRHPFLYHAVLGISALHSDLLHPSEQMSLLALEHRSISLGLLRQALSQPMTKENIDALFACQCIAVAYTLGSNGQAVSFPALKEMLTMLRATKLVVAGGGESLMTGPFGKMITLDPKVDVVNSEEVEEMLDRLYKGIDSSISTMACREALESTIFWLRRAISVLAVPEYDQVAINTFMLMIDQDVLNLLFLGEPLALAIFGNYAVCLHVVGKRHLLIRGWGRQVLTSVRERLPVEWQDSVAWAVKEVGVS